MRYRIALGLLAAALAAGCGLVDPGDGSARADLEAARALWTRAAVSDYDLDMTRLCFCWSPGEVVVQVREGVRVAVIPVETDPPTPLAPEQSAWYPTVDELFDLVDDALREGVAELRVGYHPLLGYPEVVWIDRDHALADEEVGYQVELHQMTQGS